MLAALELTLAAPTPALNCNADPGPSCGDPILLCYADDRCTSTEDPTFGLGCAAAGIQRCRFCVAGSRLREGQRPPRVAIDPRDRFLPCRYPSPPPPPPPPPPSPRPSPPPPPPDPPGRPPPPSPSPPPPRPHPPPWAPLPLFVATDAPPGAAEGAVTASLLGRLLLALLLPAGLVFAAVQLATGRAGRLQTLLGGVSLSSFARVSHSAHDFPDTPGTARRRGLRRALEKDDDDDDDDDEEEEEEEGDETEDDDDEEEESEAESAEEAGQGGSGRRRKPPPPAASTCNTARWDEASDASQIERGRAARAAAAASAAGGAYARDGGDAASDVAESYVDSEAGGGTVVLGGSAVGSYARSERSVGTSSTFRPSSWDL